MTSEEEACLEFAKALLVFKDAYNVLVTASKRLPDYDVSERYPFYLLDFEEIAPAVTQWCTVNASKLLLKVPGSAIELQEKAYAKQCTNESIHT